MRRGMIFRMLRQNAIITRHTFFRTMRFLIVGFVLTIAIAQFAALYLSFSNKQVILSDSVGKYSPPSYSIGFVPTCKLVQVVSIPNTNGELLGFKLNLGTDYKVYSFSELDLDSEITPGRAAILERYRVGWPFKSLYWDRWTALKPYPAVNEFGILLGFDHEQTDLLIDEAGFRSGINLSSKTRKIRRIPITPFWFGMIFDTAIWAMVCITPGIVWRNLRRQLRNRRGLCSTCGYAIENLAVCPECGSGDRAKD